MDLGCGVQISVGTKEVLNSKECRFVRKPDIYAASAKKKRQATVKGPPHGHGQAPRRGRGEGARWPSCQPNGKSARQSRLAYARRHWSSKRGSIVVDLGGKDAEDFATAHIEEGEYGTSHS